MASERADDREAAALHFAFDCTADLVDTVVRASDSHGLLKCALGAEHQAAGLVGMGSTGTVIAASAM